VAAWLPSRGPDLDGDLVVATTDAADNSNGPVCRIGRVQIGRGMERESDLGEAEPQTVLARQVLVGPRRRNVKEARAGCRIGGVRDRAVRNLVSSQTHRRWRHASARSLRSRFQQGVYESPACVAISPIDNEATFWTMREVRLPIASTAFGSFISCIQGR
jgi:hypothetical protein